MANRYRSFTVRCYGWRTFPLDMLRYDCCWPATEGDSSKISHHVDTKAEKAAEVERALDAESADIRSITLTTTSASAPTKGRWASFGWHVRLGTY